MYRIRLLYYKIIELIADSQQYENVTGFGLYDKEVVDLLRKSNDPTPNFRNMIGEFGYSVGIVEYFQPIRKSGISSYNFFRYFNVAMNSMITTSRVPLRMATYLGFCIAGLSFLIGMIYLILKLLFWNSFNIGLAPLIIGLFFLGAIQIIFIGILGEYIGEILTRLINRPLVVEEERINFEIEQRRSK